MAQIGGRDGMRAWHVARAWCTCEPHACSAWPALGSDSMHEDVMMVCCMFCMVPRFRSDALCASSRRDDHYLYTIT
eukprot:997408-Pelagomonas_calceolata.AAC.2